MKANSSNIADVKKYFGGTWLVVPEVSKERCFTIQHLTTEGITLQDSVTNELGFISFEDDFEYELQSPLVNRKQWFQHDGRAYLIQRIPARMWRKGICSENTQVFCFNAEGILRPAGLSSNIINSLLSWQPTEKVDLKSKDIAAGVAINSMYAFCPTKSQVFLWDHVIGKFAKRTQEVFIPKELNDLKLPDTLCSMKVRYV